VAAVGKITEDQRVLMVKLYASGETTVQIGERLQVSPTTVNRWLHRCGITLRGPRETSTRCQLRHDAFDELTPSAAYWIGFLFADGSVRRCGQSGTVGLRVSERDKDHIVKLPKRSLVPRMQSVPTPQATTAVTRRDLRSTSLLRLQDSRRGF
jgi:intein-encoded DNA endonuclease-like protein